MNAANWMVNWHYDYGTITSNPSITITYPPTSTPTSTSTDIWVNQSSAAAAAVVIPAKPPSGFNPFINASDMLSEFIKYVRQLGVSQEDVFQLPLHLFISWLIIEAAERDQEPIPEDIIPVEEDPALLQVRRPQCLSCGRFIPKRYQRHQFPYCNPRHALVHLQGA